MDLILWFKFDRRTHCFRWHSVAYNTYDTDTSGTWDNCIRAIARWPAREFWNVLPSRLFSILKIKKIFWDLDVLILN